MKIISTALFLLIASMAMPSFAGELIDKPSLPIDYSSWPDVYRYSCVLDTGHVVVITYFGRAIPGTKKAEMVLNYVIKGGRNETLIFTAHGMGLREAPDDFNLTYVPLPSGTWVKFDLKKSSREIHDMAGFITEGQLRVLGENSWQVSNCPSDEKEKEEFHQNLFQKAE